MADQGVLELRGAGDGLLDEPFALEPRGLPPGSALTWRARLRDDDGRVWRTTADSAGDLHRRWLPAKPPPGPIAALASLRPVPVDVRLETPDGAAVTRTVVRRLLDDGVRVRRWRDLGAVLHRPAEEPRGAVLAAGNGTLAAALLASRGVLVLLAGDAAQDALDRMRERLAAVPGAPPDVARLPLEPELPLPPGVPVAQPVAGEAAAREEAWDALLARLGARPRS